MKNKILVLDEGHGYNTAGKRTPDGVREWSLNNQVTTKIIDILKDYNVTIHVVSDRTGKTDVSLSERCRKSNSLNPDLFVSIHHNAFQGVWGNHTGTCAYIHNTLAGEFSKKVAEAIAPKLSKYTGLNNRGVCKDNFYVLRETTCPAVLVEGGFMDSNIDNPVITSSDGQLSYAKAVAESVIECLGLTKVGSESSQETIKGEFTYRVEVDRLNVRVGPSTSTAISTVVERGTAIEVVEIQDGWGKLKSGAGWVSLEYCEKIGEKKPEPPKQEDASYTVKVDVDVLNVRSGPGTQYKITTTVLKGDVYTIVAEEENWGKLKSGAGWICLEYCIKR